MGSIRSNLLIIGAVENTACTHYVILKDFSLRHGLPIENLDQKRPLNLSNLLEDSIQPLKQGEGENADTTSRCNLAKTGLPFALISIN